jgi:hypothetical protein
MPASNVMRLAAGQAVRWRGRCGESRNLLRQRQRVWRGDPSHYLRSFLAVRDTSV